jgi:hypothetical protein
MRWLIFLLLFCLVNSSKAQQKTEIAVEGTVKYCDSSKVIIGVTLLEQLTSGVLIDLSGKVLQKLPYGLTKLMKDGNLVAFWDGHLAKFDPDLNIIWKTPAAIHHDLTTDDNGLVYGLNSDFHQFMGLNVRFDGFVIYSAEGKLIYSWCLYDHLEDFIPLISKSPYVAHLPNPFNPAEGIEKYIAQDATTFFTHPAGDTTCNFEFSHFNSIQVIPENKIAAAIPAFKKGNLLMSFNPYSSYGIIDTTSGKICWSAYLPYRTTLHAPVLLPSGNILVYENSIHSPKYQPPADLCLAPIIPKSPPASPYRRLKEKKWVSVAEYNPITGKKVWEYTAAPKESLQADGLGNAQRLPNGNTLISVATALQGNGGEIFEVTHDKKIVWHYIAPERTSARGYTFYRAQRFDSDIAKTMFPALN